MIFKAMSVCDSGSCEATSGDLDTARPSIAEVAGTSGGEGNAPPTPESEVIAGYKVHPLASKWPLMTGKEFDDLVEAAALSRRLHAVETHAGLLIDGRNRLRAQEELRRRGIEIEVPVVEWEPTGDETVAGHIWSVNANRRHQTPDQLAVLAATTFLPAIKAEREARQKASRFGHNGKGTAASDSTPPDGEVVKPRRTRAEKDAASSAGGLAALVNVSQYKARQAITLQNAVNAGEVSEDEIAAVKAGDKPLAAVVPRRASRGKKRDRGIVRAAATHQEFSAGSSLEDELDRFWQTLTEEVPVTEHRDMCRWLKRKIAAMESEKGW